MEGRGCRAWGSGLKGLELRIADAEGQSLSALCWRKDGVCGLVTEIMVGDQTNSEGEGLAGARLADLFRIEKRAGLGLVLVIPKLRVSFRLSV